MVKYSRFAAILLLLILFTFVSGCAADKAVSTSAQPKAEQSYNSNDVPDLNDEEQTIEDSDTISGTKEASTKEVPAQTATAATNSKSDDLEKALFNYSYEEIEKYNTYFSEKTSIDLDGDGEKETVKLFSGKTKTVENTDYYSSLRISIDGEELSVQAEKNWNLGFDGSDLYGTILDIDKKDNLKEIMITEQIDFDSFDENIFEKAIIVSYKDKKPKIMSKWGMPVEANGTGYVLSIKYSKELKGGYAIGLFSIKQYSPETGFSEIPTDKYKTQSYTAQPGELTLETEWDQGIAGKPGGKKDIRIDEGSEVFFGLYDPLGWIEVFGADGQKLGWLDLNEVDIDAYIGYALEASCH